MGGGGAPEGLLECVPNVSEGRDPLVIGALADAVRGGGAELVDVHGDADHHRSVFTFLGPRAAVERSALALARVGVERIDMRRHRGVHPRWGAVDVVPFIPLRGSSMDEAVAAAHRVGAALAAALHLPVFFYGAAARRPERRELAALRRGGFEQLAEHLSRPGGEPDAGPREPHPAAGACIVGARSPLIAFNVVLDGADVAVAGTIARTVRASSGGLPAVQAMGVWLASRQLAQVSLNLLDYRRTSPRAVAERIAAESARQGVTVREHELVGCAPAEAFADWPAQLAPLTGLKATQLLAADLYAPRA
jgi:glutamate formiminotransferase / 5-formyltetrahydrofolate cyclo-ligase